MGGKGGGREGEGGGGGDIVLHFVVQALVPPQAYKNSLEPNSLERLGIAWLG